MSLFVVLQFNNEYRGLDDCSQFGLMGQSQMLHLHYTRQIVETADSTSGFISYIY